MDLSACSNCGEDRGRFEMPGDLVERMRNFAEPDDIRSGCRFQAFGTRIGRMHFHGRIPSGATGCAGRTVKPSMHVNRGSSCRFMKRVDVLRNDHDFARMIPFKHRKCGMRAIRLCSGSVLAPGIVEVVNLDRIAPKTLRRGNFVQVVSRPDTSLVAKSAEPALGRDACARQYDYLAGVPVHVRTMLTGGGKRGKRIGSRVTCGTGRRIWMGP